YQWNAAYSGDVKNPPIPTESNHATANEQVNVSQANPAINTVPSAPVLAGSGAKLNDSATLKGGYNPTGNVTFFLFAPFVTPDDPTDPSNFVYKDVVTLAG